MNPRNGQSVQVDVGLRAVPGPHPALLLRAWGSSSDPSAEADGNRTRLPALAGTPVLKTGGPTRRPDASEGSIRACRLVRDGLVCGSIMAMTHVDVLVLGLLAEEPLYGYQLLERYRARSMELWAPSGRA